MMNSFMKSTCLSALLVAANARSFGPDFGYGDLGVYGYGIYGYGEFLGVYGQDGYDGYDDLKPTPSGDKGADTCLNGECDMGDDVDDMGDEMGDFDDGEPNMPVPVPADGTPTTPTVPPTPSPAPATGGSSGGTSGGSSGGTPGVNPSSPPTPTADNTVPSSPATGTPPAGSPNSPNTQTTRSTPAVDETAEESAAAVLSGSTIMVSLLALAAGGFMLM